MVSQNQIATTAQNKGNDAAAGIAPEPNSKQKLFAVPYTKFAGVSAPRTFQNTCGPSFLQFSCKRKHAQRCSGEPQSRHQCATTRRAQKQGVRSFDAGLSCARVRWPDFPQDQQGVVVLCLQRTRPALEFVAADDARGCSERAGSQDSCAKILTWKTPCAFYHLSEATMTQATYFAAGISARDSRFAAAPALLLEEVVSF